MFCIKLCIFSSVLQTVFFTKYDVRQVNHLKFGDAKLEKEQFNSSKNDINVIK